MNEIALELGEVGLPAPISELAELCRHRVRVERPAHAKSPAAASLPDMRVWW